jgi:hypothetical protein
VAHLAPGGAGISEGSPSFLLLVAGKAAHLAHSHLLLPSRRVGCSCAATCRIWVSPRSLRSFHGRPFGCAAGSAGHSGGPCDFAPVQAAVRPQLPAP